METTENQNFTRSTFPQVSSSQVPSEHLRPIKVRCPECLKLYLVDPKELRESRPRFECLGCKTRFWLAYPESLMSEGEIIGFPLSWIEQNSAPAAEVVEESSAISTPTDALSHEVQASLPTGSPAVIEEENKHFPCPKCDTPNKAGEVECVKCGIVFQKLAAALSDTGAVSAPKEIREQWEELVMDYEDESKHQLFLRACQRQGCLDYAAYKYRKILEAHSGDEMAVRFRDAAVALASVPLTAATTPKKYSGYKRPLPVTSLILLLSSMVMAVGYLLPLARNLVGVGAAMMFLTLAMRFYFSRN